jgi:hypothetical protein
MLFQLAVERIAEEGCLDASLVPAMTTWFWSERKASKLLGPSLRRPKPANCTNWRAISRTSVA